MKKNIIQLIFLIFIFLNVNAQEHDSTIIMRNVLKDGPLITTPVFNNATKNNYYFTINSNIEYAPLGIGFISEKINSGKGYFIQIKLSEDWITRNTSKNVTEYSDYEPFDMNEAFFTAGLIRRIKNNNSYYLGIGYLSGVYFQLSDSQKSLFNPSWNEVTKKSSFSPVITGGFIYNKDKIKFILGYDIALVKPDNYPTTVLNTNSVARLTSLVVGIGYNFFSTRN